MRIPRKFRTPRIVIRYLFSFESQQINATCTLSSSAAHAFAKEQPIERGANPNESLWSLSSLSKLSSLGTAAWHWNTGRSGGSQEGLRLCNALPSCGYGYEACRGSRGSRGSRSATQTPGRDSNGGCLAHFQAPSHLNILSTRQDALVPKQECVLASAPLTSTRSTLESSPSGRMKAISGCCPRLKCSDVVPQRLMPKISALDMAGCRECAQRPAAKSREIS